MSQSGAPGLEPLKSLRQHGEGPSTAASHPETGSGQHQAGWQSPSLSEGTPVRLPPCKMEGSICYYPRCPTPTLMTTAMHQQIQHRLAKAVSLNFGLLPAL